MQDDYNVSERQTARLPAFEQAALLAWLVEIWQRDGVLRCRLLRSRLDQLQS
jgi:hypothetical protein